MTDTELIQSIQLGGIPQQKSLNHLFESHKSWVHLAKTRHQLSEEEALDAYSDAIIALKKQILSQRFMGKSKISTYLYSIFYRRCVDVIRRKSSKKSLLSEQLGENDIEDASSDIERSLIIKDRFTHLMKKIDQLGDVCRNILMDRYFWGYEDMHEIALRAGVKNANTAGSIRYRGMKQLMKMLEREGEY